MWTDDLLKSSFIRSVFI